MNATRRLVGVQARIFPLRHQYIGPPDDPRLGQHQTNAEHAVGGAGIYPRHRDLPVVGGASGPNYRLCSVSASLAVWPIIELLFRPGQ